MSLFKHPDADLTVLIDSCLSICIRYCLLHSTNGLQCFLKLSVFLLGEGIGLRLLRIYRSSQVKSLEMIILVRLQEKRCILAELLCSFAGCIQRWRS